MSVTASRTGVHEMPEAACDLGLVDRGAGGQATQDDGLADQHVALPAQRKLAAQQDA